MGSAAVRKTAPSSSKPKQKTEPVNRCIGCNVTLLEGKQVCAAPNCVKVLKDIEKDAKSAVGRIFSHYPKGHFGRRDNGAA